MKYADRVKETTTTTGTGTLTLAGAVAGFRTFLAALVDGDLAPYVLEAANGTDWETGIGTYSAGTLARTTVTASSNAGAALDLAAGTHTVFLGIIAKNMTDQREVLTSARTYYVATTGSDSNDGLTVGTPFLTLQKAINTVYALDLSSYNVTIKPAAGTYTGGITANGPFTGKGTVIIEGDTTTPANVLLSTGGSTALSVSNFVRLTVKGIKAQATGTFLFFVDSNAVLTYQSVDFGSIPGGFQLYITGNGTAACTGASVTVSGGAGYHCFLNRGTWNINSATYTFVGSPAYSVVFVDSYNASYVYANPFTYSGTVTGKRYSATMNAVINTYGLGANALPGNSAGTTATGGQYA